MKLSRPRASGLALLLSCTLGAVVACNVDDAPDSVQRAEPLRLDDLAKLPPGAVDMGPLVYGENMRGVLLESSTKQAFLLRGTKDDSVSIEVTLGKAGARGTLSIAGPATPNVGAAFASSPANADGVASLTNVKLAATGVYVVLLESEDPTALRYAMTTGCDTALPRRNCVAVYEAPMSFGRSRITQAAIDRNRYTTQELFNVGDFLFGHAFSLEEGWGNGLSGGIAGTGARPNIRRVHNGGFGGPDASSCAACHSGGGRDGAGSAQSNALLEGDGVTTASALPRNAKQVIGVGYLEALAAEMTRDLQATVAEAKRAAAAANAAQTAALTTKGVSFGSVLVQPDGTVDATNLSGVDADLVVKPFGWKGRTATLRRFVEDAFQVHLGMQFETLTRAHCAAPNPARMGDGADCEDPDRDGVKRELTEGQLMAVAVYTSLQQAPIQAVPDDVLKAQRIREGRTIFDQLGCASCHVPTLELRDATIAHVSDSTKKAFEVYLPLDGETPQLAVTGEGTVLVPLFSDLKRHDLGGGESRPSGGVPAKLFLTPPLWGLAASAPYMHDGITQFQSNFSSQMFIVIDRHNGEAAPSKGAFNAMQNEDSLRNVTPRRGDLLFAFLESLTRDPAQTKER